MFTVVLRITIRKVPSRTFKEVESQTLNGKLFWGDGHQPATEPGNPDIIYAQSQQGYINVLM